MSNDGLDAESTVSGNQANIPARIRRELDIEDGDLLRWQAMDEGGIRIDIVRRHSGTFADFDGYEGTTETNVSTDHDTLGVNDR